MEHDEAMKKALQIIEALGSDVTFQNKSVKDSLQFNIACALQASHSAGFRRAGKARAVWAE